MTNDIFTVVGFNLNQDTHTFSCDGTPVWNVDECLIINANTTIYDEIVLSCRLRYLNSGSGFFWKPVVVTGDSSGTMVDWSGDALPWTNCYNNGAFDCFYPNKVLEAQGLNPEANWFNVLISLNKSTQQWSLYYTLDDGSVLLDRSGISTSSTRNAERRWLIGPYQGDPYNHGAYDLELDLNSVKLTLDGDIYYLKERIKNMADVKVKTHLNLTGNELQNAVFQNLSSAPESPKAGQMYFNTTSGTLFVYTGSEWADALSQGKLYTFQNGLEELTGADAGKVQIKLATGANAGNVVFTADANGLAGSVDLSGKVDANAAITGATKTKITYDSKGLVTAGADLEASDIPAITLDKISDVTATAAELNVLDGITASTAELNILDGVTADASELNVLDGITASTAELNILDGVTVTASDINSIPDKIELTDLGIASASANYLTYNNANGEFGANVDTTVTADSTNLVTSGAVAAAIGTAVVGGVVYQGTWDITGASDYSGITLPVKKGYLYYVVGTGPVTIGGIEWNAGDYLLVNDDVAAGGSLVGKVEKIDNTESADIVRTAATQTLTNKTIDADDNTITDLATGNFKSGVIVTEVGATGSDTAIPTEQAVREAITSAATGMVTVDGTQTLTNKTIDADDNTITDLELDNFKSGVIVDSTTGIAATSSASDDKAVTEKAVAAALDAKTGKIVANNGALTPSGGVVTWTITNTLGTADVMVTVKEVSTNEEVIANVVTTASTVTITMNASANVAADTFRAIIVG